MQTNVLLVTARDEIARPRALNKIRYLKARSVHYRPYVNLTVKDISIILLLVKHRFSLRINCHIALQKLSLLSKWVSSSRQNLAYSLRLRFSSMQKFLIKFPWLMFRRCLSQDGNLQYVTKTQNLAFIYCIFATSWQRNERTKGLLVFHSGTSQTFPNRFKNMAAISRSRWTFLCINKHTSF